MHPVFYSARYFVAVSGLWLTLSFIISYFLSIIVNVEFLKSLILFWPLLFSYFFFCIANYFICLRVPIRGTSFIRLLTTQFASMLSTLILWLLAAFAYAYILTKATSGNWFPFLRDSLMLLAVTGAILYCFWILVHYIFLMAEQHDKLERKELQQKLLISQTELQTIKTSIHPHFLFNSLNTLANLALIEPKKVHRICLQMAEFFRYSVSYGRRKSATVGDELEHIKNYLAIERERFGARLKTAFDVDESLLPESVLPLLLLPLVENSIKHGIDNSLEGGTITVKIKKDLNALVIRIENPYDASDRSQTGEHFGLESVRKRLNAHYGDAGKLKTIKESDRFIVELALPVNFETI